MRKNHRGQRPESDEPLSAGRVEYLEQARARVRARRLRRTALIVAVLTAVVLFTTGLVGSSVALVKDCVALQRTLQRYLRSSLQSFASTAWSCARW